MNTVQRIAKNTGVLLTSQAIRKLYKSKSRLIDVGKEKIAPGVLLINSTKESLLKALFDKYGVKIYSIKKIWTH